MAFEQCPGCQALLPKVEGPTHRYIGASPACWAIYTALHNGGEPPLASGPLNGLLVDAYAAQHPGTPGPQATQSVAVHLLVLYGVLAKGMSPDMALWIRQRALRQGKGEKHGRYAWLTPPPFNGSLSVADIVQSPTPAARAEQVTLYVESVWSLWAVNHAGVVSRWYQQFVAAD